MDQSTLSYDGKQPSYAELPSTVSEQRLITANVLKRLELRRQAVVRIRMAWASGCFALVLLAGGLMEIAARPGQVSVTSLLMIILAALAIAFLSYAAILPRQNEVSRVVDLIEKNRLALRLLDLALGREPSHT